MFNPFQSQFRRPAWAEAGPDDRFFAHEHHRPDRHRPRRQGGRWGEDPPGRWGDEPRARRGDIKFMLLALLVEQPRHGYELIKELESRWGGFRRLSPGSVYPTLQLLEDGGYLTSEQVEGKRVYTVTESGRQLLNDRTQQQPDRPIDGSGSLMTPQPSELAELRKAWTDLGDAVAQLARSGNLQQANQVRDRLVEVKREIYRLLSEQ